MGQNPKPRRQDKIYLQRVIHVVHSFHHHRRCWATFIQYLPVNRAVACLHYVPRTEDVGLPTQFRFNVGPVSQPIAVSMPVNRLRRWPNTNPTLGLLILCATTSANTWHSSNAVLMLTHSLRRRPNIKTALSYCPVFSGCAVLQHCYAGDAFPSPSPERPLSG